MGGRLLEGPTMVGRTSDWKEELGRFLKPFLDRLGLVAFHVGRLIAKEQDLMLRQRLVQLLDLAVAERLGERQAADLGADARRDRRDVDGFGAHGVTSRVRGKYMSFRGQLRLSSLVG